MSDLMRKLSVVLGAYAMFAGLRLLLSTAALDDPGGWRFVWPGFALAIVGLYAVAGISLRTGKPVT